MFRDTRWKTTTKEGHKQLARGCPLRVLLHEQCGAGESQEPTSRNSKGEVAASALGRSEFFTLEFKCILNFVSINCKKEF